MRTSKLLMLAVAAATLLCPAGAFAQATIAGAVRDTSGALLPGVTVEAASPALIEKVRTASTDGSGQYRIVDLRPGVYSVTFVLQGFNTVRRDGIELAGTFVATINAELQVGALQETITVSAESPVVDVQSARSEQRIAGETLAAIPTGRQYFSLTALVPGISTQGADVGGSAGPSFSVFRSRGGGSDEGMFYLNGFPTGYLGLGVSYYVADLGAAAETTFALGGGMGESRTGGPLLNVIPKEGGNSLSGSFYANGANGALEGSNFTQAHRDAGLRTPNQLQSIWDVNTNVGGPIQRDRVWFFSAFRHQGNRKTVANMWANRNAGDPTKWTYEPDLSNQATDGGNWMNGSVRVTTQLTQRNKFSVFWDEQKICRLCEGGEGTATTSPEATPTNEGFPQRHVHGSWTSPLTSNWLLDGGVSLNYVQFGGVAKDGDTTGLVRVTEQGGLIPGITYRSTNWTRPTGESWTWRGSASHITGARRIKIGYEGNHHTSQGNNYTNNTLLAYQLNNGVPNRLTMTAASPIVNNTHSKDHAVYGQAQWTRQRLTVQAGVRYEYIDSGFPENRIGPSLFLSQPVVFPAQESPVSLHDVAPRFAATYDVFGTGKTALKMSVGRYMLEPAGAQIYANPYSPVSRVVTSTNRAWTDIDTDFAPDCDLLNPATNGECGPLSNVNFGREVFTTNYDRDIVEGWNTRLQTWDINAGVRHELMPRLGIEAEYVRRIFGNFRVTDNQAVGPEDFDTFSITAPVDPRLPDGGGYTISGLFDVKPAKFGAVNNLVILSDTIGKQTRHYNGLNVNVNARLSNGLTVQGGFSSGTTTEDICDIRAKLPELTVTNIQGTVQGVSPLHPYCHVSSGFLTDLSGLATYTVPKISLQVSGTWSSRPVVPHRDSNYTVVPNESLAANAVVTNAQIAPSLGRNLSGGLANATINLVEPGTLYGDRITSLDFRVARVQRLGTRRLLFGIDIYNILNASSVLSYNQTYGPRWLTPTGILQARFAKLSAQLDF